MKITIELNEKNIEETIAEKAIEYIKEKQLKEIVNTAAKTVAKDIKADIEQSGIVEEKINTTIKRIESSLITRSHKQLTEIIDNNCSQPVHRATLKDTESKSVRNNIIAALIGFQNEIGCDEQSEAYKAYQKTIEWIEETYGPLMS